MPTGAGKSVLMTVLVAALAEIRRKYRVFDERRTIILVTAPLNRIKLRLFEKFKIIQGDNDLCYDLWLISSDSIVHNGIVKEISVTDAFRNAVFSAEPRKMVLTGGIKTMTYVIIASPQALVMVSEDIVFEKLKERLLALFVDDVHVMFKHWNKSFHVLKKLMKHSPVALGFSATPIKDTFRLFGNKFLLGNPLYSNDLMRESGRVLAGEQSRIIGDEPVLVPKLRAVFMRTVIKLEEPVGSDRGIIWKGYSRNSVEKYVDTMLSYLKRHFGVDTYNIEKLKVLVLAQTRERLTYGVRC